MNNIYKVIWSKAKNCYVVASEIARSHTKSASGSEKIGGVTRHSLLASLMALSLLCGGLGVASATDVVHVDENATGAVEVYTKTGVDTELGKKADKTAVEEIKNTVGDVDSGLVKKTADNATGIEVNKTNISALKETVGDDTKGLTKKINDNTAAIAMKADTAAVTTLEGRVGDVEEKVTTLEGTVGDASSGLVKDVATLKTTVGDASSGLVKDVTALETTVGDASSGLVKDVADLRNQGNDLNNALGSKANKSDLDEANAKITDLQAKTAKLSDDGTALTDMTTVSGTTVSGTNVEAGALKVKGEISNGAGVTTTLADIKGSMTQTAANKDAIDTLQTTTNGQQTAIDGLNAKTTKITYDAALGTNVDGVTFNAGAVTGVKSINGTEIGTKESGTYISQDGSIWGNMKNVDTQVKTNADAIAQEKTDRENAIGSLTEDKNYIKKDNNVSDNLVELDKQAKTNADAIAQEKTDRENAIGSLTEDKNYIKKDKNVSDNLVELDKQAKTNADAIAQEKTDRENAIGSLTEDKNYIKKDKNVSDNLVELDKQAKTNADAIAQEKTDRENAIGSLTEDKNYIKKDKNVSDNLVELDKQAKTNADAITETNQRTAGITRDDTKNETSIEGKVTVDTNGNIKAEGTITSNGLDAKFGDIKTNGKVSAGDVSTGTLETTGNATIGGNLDVTGTLNIKDVTAETIHVSKSEDNADYKSEGSIIGDGGKLSVSNEKTDKRTNITEKSELNVNEKGTVNWATSTDNATGNVTEGRSEVTADNIKNSVKKTEGGKTFGYEENITADGKVGTVTDKEGNTSTTRQDSKGVYGYAKDKDGNKSYTKQEGNRIAESVIGQDGKETKSEMTSTDITNTAKDGTITNDAKDIVNNATGDMTNNVGGNLSTTVGGNEIHEVKGTKTETVEGKVTENFKNGQETNVTGNQDIHVTGKQTNTVGGGQENIISGGQTNTINGGQINNITGDQTTTITGNKTETVTENVTEDYKKNLTTTVGGNEIHEVKGTKTETVEGKLTENFKGGQETNVTGDQTTNVSGTQTTTATDINRNASSGMIDTIDNDYGTNTETKVAGKTTTDVSIKGTGEKGQYIRGANESRDYLIKGTLKNSETKTAEATSTEITDGTNKASTIQDAKNLAGSVTNGTETGVSGIHANNDGSVSIDSSVAGGGMSSVINQKKDSIQSAVGDGTNSTVIHQDKDNVTIASSNGMVGLVGKDIVNNAQNTITNTAGTKITDTAGDSTVTTENGKGTTFTKTGSTAYREGGPTDTNISGNTITTGKVTMDYADVMKDLGVRGNANITGKTTTGSLEVTGTSTLTGDVTMESNAKVKKDLTVEGTTKTKTLNVTENATVGGTLDVTGKATFRDDVDIKKNLSVVGDVTANSYKVGDKTYIDAAGINANDQKITNVADGSIAEGSKDAVNGGQLYTVKNDLEGKVNKVGANAAAMANLHPMEFDPDSKWNIAAAIGNYGSETAAALGAFYRPNDDVMVNLSTAFGTGENMVGGGVSVRLGQGGNKLSREDSNQLKAQVADLTARMDALLSVLNPNMSKDFPDVPENHWAYEAVSRLAGNDIVQGYPDGEFHGERTMTRYEMAEIIYNALSRGAEAEKELVEEFKPELQAMAASEKATAERAEG